MRIPGFDSGDKDQNRSLQIAGNLVGAALVILDNLYRDAEQGEQEPRRMHLLVLHDKARELEAGIDVFQRYWAGIHGPVPDQAFADRVAELRRLDAQHLLATRKYQGGGLAEVVV